MLCPPVSFHSSIQEEMSRALDWKTEQMFGLKTAWVDNLSLTVHGSWITSKTNKIDLHLRTLQVKLFWKVQIKYTLNCFSKLSAGFSLINVLIEPWHCWIRKSLKYSINRITVLTLLIIKISNNHYKIKII